MKRNLFYEVLQGGCHAGFFKTLKAARVYLEKFNTKTHVASTQIIKRRFVDDNEI